MPHVGKEPRRAEATGHGKRGAGHQRRSKSGHQRVGVEQGHRRVADVLRSELEHHGHPVARGQQSTLRAAHRLGRGRRSGCEEQRPESVHVGVGQSSPALTSRVVIGPGRLQCLLERLTRGRRLVSVGETVRDEDPTWECHSLGARSQLLLVTRLGDDELDVGVRDVVAEMLAPTRVVQPGHGGTGQARTAERKDVVGRVVQQKTDVGGTARVEPGAVQRGKALRFGQKLPVCPLAVAEAQGRTVGIPGIRAVATQERRCVRSRERHLGQRWSEPSERRGGVPRRSEPRPRRPPPPSYLAPSRPPITMTDHSLFTLSPRSRRRSTSRITAVPGESRSIEAAPARPPATGHPAP